MSDFCLLELRGKGDSPLISGYQIYHNYIRLHMSLKGKTPSEVAGIKIKRTTNGRH